MYLLAAILVALGVIYCIALTTADSTTNIDCRCICYMLGQDGESNLIDLGQIHFTSAAHTDAECFSACRLEYPLCEGGSKGRIQITHKAP